MAAAIAEAKPLPPGRYVVRGGPRGEMAVTRPRKDRYARQGGRLVHYIATASYADRWPVLARVRVRPGHTVTWWGLLGAVARVWEVR